MCGIFADLGYNKLFELENRQNIIPNHFLRYVFRYVLKLYDCLTSFFYQFQNNLEQKLLNVFASLKGAAVRSAMVERGIGLIDGGGAARIAKVIAMKSMSEVSVRKSNAL